METPYYLIIGRSGAGKTTYAGQVLTDYLNTFNAAVVIDGDAIRNLYKNQDYTDVGRLNNINSCTALAKRYMELNIVPIIAIVCPTEKLRIRITNELGPNSNLIYIEGGTLWKNTSFEVPSLDYKIIPAWRD